MNSGEINASNRFTGRTGLDLAARLDVQLFSVQSIETWEKSLGIPADAWPCRGDYSTFDPAKAAWQRLSAREDADDDWRLLRDALAFIDVESWLTFRYRLLNKLLRLLGDIVQRSAHIAGDRDKALCARYAISALLVRLSQACGRCEQCDSGTAGCVRADRGASHGDVNTAPARVGDQPIERRPPVLLPR